MIYLVTILAAVLLPAALRWRASLRWLAMPAAALWIYGLYVAAGLFAGSTIGGAAFCDSLLGERSATAALGWERAWAPLQIVAILLCAAQAARARGPHPCGPDGSELERPCARPTPSTPATPHPAARPRTSRRPTTAPASCRLTTCPLRRGSCLFIRRPSGPPKTARRAGGIHAASLGELLMYVRDTHPSRLLLDHALPSQDVVIVLGEAVGFVPDLLEQPQGLVVAGQPDRGGAGLDVNLLFPLCQ